MVSFDLKKLFRVPDAEQRLGGLHLRPDLHRAVGQMASDSRSDERIKPVEDLLTDSETVVRIVEGLHDKEMGFLVLTTEHVLFRAHRAGLGLGDITPLGQVTGVEDRAKGITGRVRIDTEAGSLEVKQILGIQATQFAQDLRKQLDAPGVAPRDPVAALLELRERRAAGLVGDADYQTAKAALLDEL